MAAATVFGLAGHGKPKLCQMAAPLKTLTVLPGRVKIGLFGVLPADTLLHLSVAAAG
jgi:hypothetical protein